MALARALITSPQILLLDEPLSALDPFLRLRMRTELKKLQRELGITFIHVTHGQDEAMALANIVVLMNAGRIEQQGTPREIFNHPQTEFTAKFIGGHNVIAVGDESFAVRNDRLIAEEARRQPSTVRRIGGTVSEVEYQGTYVRVAIAADGGTDISAATHRKPVRRRQLQRGRARHRHLGSRPWPARSTPEVPATVTPPDTAA